MADAQDPAATARQVMLGTDRATLATWLGEGAEAFPYGSLVLVAFDWGLAPLLLISTLAEHTKNLQRSRRASLLFDGTQGLADPLTGARMTLLGEAAPILDDKLRERLLERYVARHPSAEMYKGFKDFAIWRLDPGRAHLVAGFGRIHWIEPAKLVPSPEAAAALAEAEPGILAHMNGDHAGTVDLYAETLLRRSGTGWRITGVDPYGADLRRDAAAARLDFAAPVNGPEAVRREFVRLARLARGEAPHP